MHRLRRRQQSRESLRPWTWVQWRTKTVRATRACLLLQVRNQVQLQTKIDNSLGMGPFKTWTIEITMSTVIAYLNVPRLKVKMDNSQHKTSLQHRFYRDKTLIWWIHRMRVMEQINSRVALEECQEAVLVTYTLHQNFKVVRTKSIYLKVLTQVSVQIIVFSTCLCLITINFNQTDN